MINNYSKNDLLPPSSKKKYSRNHMILLIYIYYLKNFMSISDIKSLLAPLKNHFYDDDRELSFFDIYEEIYQLEHRQKPVIAESVADDLKKAREFLLLSWKTKRTGICFSIFPSSHFCAMIFMRKNS